MIPLEKYLSEWEKFSRRDDCLDQMVPSELRQLVGQVTRLKASLEAVLQASSQLMVDGNAKVGEAKADCEYRLIARKALSEIKD